MSLDLQTKMDILAQSKEIFIATLTNTSFAEEIKNKKITISSIFNECIELIDPTVEKVEELKPAIDPKKSISSDYIVCLEDGKKFKSLTRHIKTHYNLTPKQYIEKWNLPYDYPMTAPNYSDKRKRIAKEIGLGIKNNQTSNENSVTAE